MTSAAATRICRLIRSRRLSAAQLEAIRAAAIDFANSCSPATAASPGSEGSEVVETMRRQAAADETFRRWSHLGVEAVDRALKFAQEWEELHVAGLARMSQERYVAVNLAKSRPDAR